MTDSAGTTVWKADYEPFGKAAIRTQTIINNLRLPGQYFDAETGLHYNYFRDYDSTTGRYVESDPIGLAGGLNVYLYGQADPLKFTDPDGLDPFGSNSTGTGGFTPAPTPFDVFAHGTAANQAFTDSTIRGINAFSDFVKSLSKSEFDECVEECEEDKIARDALCFIEQAKGGKAAQRLCLSNSDRKRWECEEDCKKKNCSK